MISNKLLSHTTVKCLHRSLLHVPARFVHQNQQHIPKPHPQTPDDALEKSLEKHFERLAERMKIEVHAVMKAEVQTIKMDLKEIFRVELKNTDTLITQELKLVRQEVASTKEINNNSKTLEGKINSINVR